MTDPTDYHRKLAEAIDKASVENAWGEGKPQPRETAIAAVLASEGVVEPAEVERLEAELAGRRKPDLDDCSQCGYPMDNEDPDEGDDQWFCPRCKLTAEVERLEEAHANLIAEDRDEQAVGMEQAAKIVETHEVDNEDPIRIHRAEFAAAIRAEKERGDE